MKTIKYLSMAALALVGTMTVGCSSDDNFIEQTQQPVNSNNVVTLTATVGFDEAASNRALAIDYTNKKLTKTFAEGDQIAVIYENTSGTMVKETATIAAGDISTDGKSAKFTVSMTDPKASGTLKYIYPAAMAGATDVDYTKLASQDGTLASLASNLDLATFEGTLTAASELPASAALKNKLAILAFTLKDNAATPTEITSSITSLTFTDGTNTYSVNRSAAAGPIYVAIKPTSGADIDFYATDGTNNYMKSVTSKTYAANNIYQQGLKMNPGAILSLVTSNIVAQDGETLTGALAADATTNIKIAENATVTLKDVTINGTNVDDDAYKHAGITCAGTATIKLEGTNSVKGFHGNYPGIYVPDGKTLTIQGTGSLTASSNGSGAGIGGGNGISCGNITISGGTVTATGGYGCAGIGGGFSGTCGTITISGGTITATGGELAAGIGSGYWNDASGTITITSGVTSVKATAGSGAQSIGKGDSSPVISVTIGGTVYASGISESPYEYTAPPALTLTTPAVGEVIGSDGKNYAADATLPTGVTKVAMIAYVSGSNGLAIALADESGYMNWATAKSTCEAKTPAFTGGTWKLPSLDEWKNMLTYDGDSYWNNNLQTALSTAGGNSLQEWIYYWSSTDYVSDNTQACDVEFMSGYANFSNESKTDSSGKGVRAVLAF